MEKTQKKIKNWQKRQVYLDEQRNQQILKTNQVGASLVAQWLRVHLPKQGTRVRALVREDPTCHGATKPVRHNY